METSIVKTEQKLPVRKANDIVTMLLADKRSRETKRAYKHDLDEFFSTVYGENSNLPVVKDFLSLSKVKGLTVALNYKAKLLEKNLSEATINRKLSSIRALVDLAYKTGHCNWKLDGLPNEKIKAYRDTSGVSIEQIRKTFRVISKETIKGKRDYAIMLLLWENGLRRSEVIGCDVTDFNREEKTLKILGKGSGSQKEFISLSDRTVIAISDYLDSRNIDDIPLFINVDRADKGNGRLTPQAIYYLVRDVFKKSGASKMMSPHRVRHSAITAALDLSNGNIRRVQRFSRHAKIETLQIYDDNRQNFQGEITELLSKEVEN